MSHSSTHYHEPAKTAGGCGRRLTPVLLLVPPGLMLIAVAFMAISCVNSSDTGTRPRLHQAYLADLNGNGHLDAFLVPLNDVHRTLANDGSGRFTLEQEFTMRNQAVLALGDINGDDQADVILNQLDQQGMVPVCAAAPEGLTAIGPTGVISSHSLAIVAGQHVVTCCKGGSNLVDYGPFTDHFPCLGQKPVNGVALADLNGNGRLDAFLAKGWDGSGRQTPNEVWFNDGQGLFSDSGQRLGSEESFAVVLGDLNGNGFLDAVVANAGTDQIWFNDGQGNFSDSGQALGNSATHVIFLADLNGNGHLDLFLAGTRNGHVRLNDGTGRFSSGQSINYSRGDVVALGDVTGNGHADLFVAGLHNYRVWQGGGNGRFASHLQGNYR